jgi:Carboxypeptidase regulatory-like domain
MSSTLLALGTRLLLAVVPLAAQDGLLKGRVQDAVTLTPVRSGLVQAADTTGTVRRRTSLDPRGGFHLALPPGPYALTITAIGYRPAQLGEVAIAAGESRDLSISLERLQFLEEIVVPRAAATKLWVPTRSRRETAISI